MKRTIFILALLSFAFLQVQCKPSSEAQESEKQGPSLESVIAQKIRAGALVLDVRTPGEYAAGHYKGAINIPVSELSGRLSELGADKKKPIVVYCASGARSGAAKRLLEEAGFVDVINGINQSHLPSR